MNALPTWALVATLLVVPASAALAQPGSAESRSTPGEAGRDRGGPGEIRRAAGERGPLARLGLNDAQRAQLAEIRSTSQAESAGLRRQVMRLSHELRGAMLEDRPDRRKILRLAGQIGEVRAKLGVQRVEHRLAILDVLTPEQRDRWLQSSRRGGETRGKRPGRPGSRGFGGGGRSL
jgi:Spy/CpxP family protein refolding chaperone